MAYVKHVAKNTHFQYSRQVIKSVNCRIFTPVSPGAEIVNIASDMPVTVENKVVYFYVSPVWSNGSDIRDWIFNY